MNLLKHPVSINFFRLINVFIGIQQIISSFRLFDTNDQITTVFIFCTQSYEYNICMGNSSDYGIYFIGLIFLMTSFIIQRKTTKLIHDSTLYEKFKFINPAHFGLTEHAIFLTHRLPPIKIFVYNVTAPDYNHHMRLIRAYIGNLNNPKGREICSSSMMFDYFITEIITNSSLNEKDGDKADIFLDDMILSLYYNHGPSYTKYAIDPIKDKYPYFNRSQGIDHILLQNTFACHLTPFRPKDEKEFPGMTSMGD
ncbi:hypothetical protein TRFO_39859 [Tritrichomonas foetus]|uniref:Exostosin GT47 domain-containing protein n=1 Tax=Tritrichomonas foetus TaxID=1144522 RepID=A0A1J4J961_9EUKA|nr:hypothetical protein TRFO_39859 [Tritrichomonas foetus]|eukprot:OHS93949.1 hypothetical protein TRFO_39859 [Tritrichomonas foetus]